MKVWICIALLAAPALGASFAIENLKVGPNPYQPVHSNLYIQFTNNHSADIHIRIYSITGIKVWDHQYNGNSGNQFQEWDGRDLTGSKVPPGMYMVLIQMQSGTQRAMAKWPLAVIR